MCGCESNVDVRVDCQPKVTRKIHSFKSMPNAQRRVIHELAESYGCQTESYDEEPNKNVVATAVRYVQLPSFFNFKAAFMLYGCLLYTSPSPRDS